MHRRIDTSVLSGRRRTVIEIRFSDDPRPFWLVAESGKPSVCLADPGFEVDVTVRSDLDSMHRLGMGQLPMREALRGGRVVFEGPRALLRQMPNLLQLSEIAEAVAAVQGA